MKKTLITLSVLAASAAQATPFTGNDAKSNAMGNTGVASAASFSMGQFNPALLAATSTDYRFGLLLPSVKIAIDDSKGFVKHTNDNFIEGDVIANFQAVSFDDIQNAVSGGGGDPSLSAVVSSASTNSGELSAAIDAEDYTTASNEAAELQSDVNILDQKVITIRTELTDFQVAFNDASDGVSGYEGKPFQVTTALGAAFSRPDSRWGWSVHFNNESLLGATANIAESDLTQLNNAVSDLVGYADEASDVTRLSNNLTTSTSTLVTLLDNQPTTGTAQEQADWAEDVEAATDEVIRDQADLDAESSGTDTTVTLSDGSTQYVGESDGNNVDTYTSTNGYFTGGSFNDSQTAGLGDDSTITIVGANILEVGVSLARDFEYMGESFSLGVTPKLLSVTVFEDTIQLNNAEEEIGDDPSAYLSSNTESYFSGNVDIGAAKTWNDVLRGTVRAGIVIKDLIPQTFEATSGTELEIGPKMRIGGAHTTRWTTLAVDLDITENQPLKYGVPTRYLGLGAEFNAYNWFKLRAGYRNNLSIEDSHVVSGGFGLTPWGVGLDMTGWFKPKSVDNWDEVIQDAGVVAQFSMEF
jgi:hypothetical protein